MILSPLYKGFKKSGPTSSVPPGQSGDVEGPAPCDVVQFIPGEKSPGNLDFSEGVTVTTLMPARPG